MVLPRAPAVIPRSLEVTLDFLAAVVLPGSKVVPMVRAVEARPATQLCKVALPMAVSLARPLFKVDSVWPAVVRPVSVAAPQREQAHQAALFLSLGETPQEPPWVVG